MREFSPRFDYAETADYPIDSVIAVFSGFFTEAGMLAIPPGMPRLCPLAGKLEI
jgi:hypothetical protein